MKKQKRVVIKRRIHSGYSEFQKLEAYCKARGRDIPIGNHFGKYQYFCESDKGRISLIFLDMTSMAMGSWWEILELSDNKLFEDTERFSTKKEALKRIKELL